MSKRDANGMLSHHLEVMARNERNIDVILEDYAENVVAINNVYGPVEIVKGRPALGEFIQRGFTAEADSSDMMSKMKVLYRESYGNFTVYAVSFEPALPLAVFVYSVQDGNAVYVTGYQKVAGVEVPDYVSKETASTNEAMAVVDHNIAAMASRDPEYIASDYAEDAVVLVNLTDKPVLGRTGIIELLTPMMAQEIDPNTPLPRFVVKEAANEMVLLSFEDASGMIGTETYIVRNGKIIFESSVFKNP